MSGSFSSLNYASLDCRSASHRKVDSWFFFLPITFFFFATFMTRSCLSLVSAKTRAKNHEKLSNNNLNFSIFFRKDITISLFNVVNNKITQSFTIS